MQELVNKKKQLAQQYANQEQMRAYQENKQKANNAENIYKISSSLGRIGQGLSETKSPLAQNIGKNMYKYSTANLEDNAVNGIKNVANKVFASKGVPTGMASNITDLTKTLDTTKDVADTANTVKDVTDTANTVKDVANTASTASNALSTAGSVAGGALSALNVGSDIAQKKYGDAAIDGASWIASMFPGGAIVSGALQLGKFIKNTIKGARDKKAQAMADKSNSILQESQNRKQESMNNLAGSTQETAQTPEEMKQVLSEQVLPNQDNNNTYNSQQPLLPEGHNPQGYTQQLPELQEEELLSQITPEEILEEKRRRGLV